MILDSVQSRLRHWRTEVKGLSVREFQAAVNEHLSDGGVSLGTVSNYEQPPDGPRSAQPRADYLAGVKRAFPELRIEWLLLGAGPPSLAAGRAAEAAGGRPAGGGAPEEGSLGGRVLAAHPDLGLLSPEGSALFLGALTRYATGEPGLDLGEDRILELASDLRWLLFLPLSLWGFRHDPDYERFSAYSVALLHALALLMPEAGRGDAASSYDGFANRSLRERFPAGLGEPAGA